jgi:hypothetical protein
MSAEDRAAQLYKTGAKPPAPPSNLAGPARERWQTIVNSLPADYFPGFTLPALALYVRCLVECDRTAAALEEASPGSDEAARLTRDLKTLRLIAAQDARALRLTLQSRLPNSGIHGERGADPKRDDLIGGTIVPLQRR